MKKILYTRIRAIALSFAAACLLAASACNSDTNRSQEPERQARDDAAKAAKKDKERTTQADTTQHTTGH